MTVLLWVGAHIEKSGMDQAVLREYECRREDWAVWKRRKCG